MERFINIHVRKLPEGVYLATSEDIQGLVAQGRTATETLEIAFQAVESLIEKPVFVDNGHNSRFKYLSESLDAAILQKAARLVSGLNAALVLLENGFIQELGVIFRTLDEFFQDIIFLLSARSKEILSDYSESIFI